MRQYDINTFYCTVCSRGSTGRYCNTKVYSKYQRSYIFKHKCSRDVEERPGFTGFYVNVRDNTFRCEEQCSGNIKHHYSITATSLYPK